VDLYRAVRPLLFLLPAESAHGLALFSMRLCQAVPPLRAGLRRFAVRDPALSQELFGRSFPGPLGIAAGLDKNGVAVPFFSALGCGFVEVGSVTHRPCAGNPRPRAFRRPADRALVNRMGLPSEGAEAVAVRLGGLARTVPIGINLAKTNDPRLTGPAAIDDFCASFQRLAPLSDYAALNISCPNTEDGRTFEEPEALAALLGALAPLRGEVPLLIKLSPTAGEDPGRLRELLAVARAHRIAGLIACNTLKQGPAGGLSGRPLARLATDLMRRLYRETGGALPLIGVGGIDSAAAAYERIRAGASLLQAYTGLVYEGPGLVRRIHRGLLGLLQRDGLSHISDAVGKDA
jgi:dihydroorotate dehydrogenase